ERVGIYGHSGGGFMSTAALLVKPYNEFFKVAVSSAGNHDNNVYNNSWAERYHGMKELPGKKDETKKDDAVQKGPPKGGKFKGKGGGGDDLPQDKGQEQKKDDQKDDKKDDTKKDDTKKDQEEKKDVGKKETHFEIRVPTNPELAANLKGKLLLVHGDMD